MAAGNRRLGCRVACIESLRGRRIALTRRSPTMKPMKREIELTFEETVRGLFAGDFSRLAPLFETQAGASPCSIIRWYESGRFDNEPKAVAEAFTCACFNGCTDVIEYFLTKGVNPNGGINTGLNAFHWAVNRGQLKAVEILIRNQATLETQNSYGGTVLGSAVWSAVHEQNLTIFGLLRRCSRRARMSARRIIHQATSRLMNCSGSTEQEPDKARHSQSMQRRARTWFCMDSSVHRAPADLGC